MNEIKFNVCKGKSVEVFRQKLLKKKVNSLLQNKNAISSMFKLEDLKDKRKKREMGREWYRERKKERREGEKRRRGRE